MADLFSSGSLIESISIVLALSLSGLMTFLLVKPIIRKMQERNITGLDWNKKDGKRIPELGGIAVLFGFPIGISIATGVFKLFGPGFNAIPILAVISVMFIAGMIGIIDDISVMPQRIKALVVAFAALPLIIAGWGDANISLPFGFSIDLSSAFLLGLLYWVVIVPIAITGASNAMNMSAGYNGLESGQVTIISLSLLVVAMIMNSSIECYLVFAALIGSAIGLNYYNGYPAVTFVGDVGTLSMGATIGAGAIIGGLEFAGIIAIAPAFFEAFSTVYYSAIKRVDRKIACSRPIIDDEGRLHAPEGAKYYTLAFFILTKRPMSEKNLVRTILGIYAIFGAIAIVLSLT